MDRQIVYAGAIPLETDLLAIQRNMQVGLGALARAILGDAPLVDGMWIVPGGAPYTVLVGPGSLTVGMENDYAPFGALPPDHTTVVRTALLPVATLVGLAPTPDAAHIVRWLIQAAVDEIDAVPVALPYWNASDPAIAFAGPGNSGAAQNTQRQLRVRLSVKPGSPQLTPGGPVPSPDAGWIGLYVVTVYPGKPGIEQGDIVAHGDVPRLRYLLPGLPAGRTQQAVFGSTTEWRVPDGVRSVKIRLVGGGGGGGGGDPTYSGGGGGAGGYAEAMVPVTPQQLYSVVVGLGGTGGSPTSQGLPGGTSVFGEGLVVAGGGSGGGSNVPDSHGGDPGYGVIGSLLQPGGYGGDGAAAALIPGGNGGASAFGGGGRGANGGGSAAQGTAAGSGGGGAYGNASFGGQGAPGLVIIEY